MRPYESLGGRGQLGRIRRLARDALAAYPGDLKDGRLTLLRHEQNVTFRVDGGGTRHVLRISRPDLHSADTIGSEMAWLAALARETSLRVPSPVTARDGALVVAGTHAGVPEARPCVLLRWLDGRFLNRGLTPDHLALIGAALGELQVHAAGWTPPSGFVRPRVDTLTTTAKRVSLVGPTEALGRGPWPSVEDGERATALVRDLVSAADAGVVEDAIALVRATTATLAGRPDAAGLIHGDLHQENVLFDGPAVGVIDFDDCGWGFFLYDLAVPLSEVTLRPAYPAMRNALLEAYARRRPLPDDAGTHVDAFIVLRGLQILVWVLESRDLPAFRDRWADWVRAELDWLAGRVGRAIVRT
jgi:Ser/Thr protein kinase RdoA (MazF antagonist)